MIIWSSPLSDCHRTLATNQYALSALSYLMWKKHLPITEIDREARKIIVEEGGKHPLSSTALCYLTRESGGRGLRSVEAEYKAIEIKGAFNLFNNNDNTIALVHQFENRSIELGHNSMVN